MNCSNARNFATVNSPSARSSNPLPISNVWCRTHDDPKPDFSDQVDSSRAKFAQNIERLAKELELSWPELERKSGVARQTIYRARTKKRGLSIDDVTRIACAFGVEPHTLLE